MTQYSLPTSDFLASQWTQGAGDGDGDFFDELDEGFGAGRGTGSGPDDSGSYWQNSLSVGGPIECHLAPVNDPSTSSGHIIKSRSCKNSSGGRQIDYTVRLKQGSSDVGSQTFTNIDNVWTTRTYTLTAGEANSITNYSDLRASHFASEVGGGQPRIPWESAMEFECPDAPAGGGFAYSQGIVLG